MYIYIIKFPNCVFVSGGIGGRNIRTTYEGGGGLVELYESVHGGGASKITRFLT